MTLDGDDRQSTPGDGLASIRRTIKTNAAEGSCVEKQRPAAVAAAEPDDFELPAMFRRDRDDAPGLPTSLVGRLSAALRPPPLPETPLGLASSTPAYSPSEPVSALLPPLLASNEGSGLEKAGPRASEGDAVPREMPPCRDRLMVRMAMPLEPPTLPPSRGSVVPRATVGRANYLIGAASAIRDFDDDDMESMAFALPPMPPGIPETLGAEAAAHLRPMLTQWLDDNLSRVFTEALISTLQRDRET